MASSSTNIYIVNQTDATRLRANCLPFNKYRPRGIFMQDDPLDYPYTLLLAQIILTLLISQVLYFFLRPLGQTKFVCNLLGGFILGPSMLGQNKAFKDKMLFGGKQVPLFDTIALLGIVYSVFLIAVKFDLAMFKRTANDAWKIGLVGFLFTSTITAIFIYIMDINLTRLNGFLLFATISLSLTYFPVVAEALDELNLVTSELGQLAMSSAVTNDGIQWILMATHLLSLQLNTKDRIRASICLLMMILFTILVTRPIINLIIKKTPKGQEVKEGYVTAILLSVLVMALISDVIGMKETSGPLLLGLLIPHGPPLGAAIVHKTEYLVSEFLLPAFFFRIGFTINVHSIDDWTGFNNLQLVVFVTYAAKIVGVTMTAFFFCKIRLKSSILLSLIMSMKGIIDVIVFKQWWNMKEIDDQIFTQFVLSSLAMTMIVTPLVRFFYKPLGLSESILPWVRNIQSMPRNSEMFRILCCIHNEGSVPAIIHLLEASNPTAASPICAYIVHTVELRGRTAPRFVHCKRSEKEKGGRTSTTTQIMRAFDNYSKASNGPLMTQTYTMIAPYKCMHETLFRLADEKFVPLIIVPFHENQQGVVDLVMISAVRQFNENVQSYSKCTVGILVDRGLTHRLSFANFSCNVALFFIGGPDDRETLAYATRLSGNPDVNMTVFRILLQSKSKDENEEEEVEEKIEVELDEKLVNEFRVRNSGNYRLIWREIEVWDGVQLMDAVMKSQGDYDLVMVGRRHSDMTLRDEEMAEFLDNAELGVIGDIVASSDFCKGAVNVLVMQESMELGYGIFRSQSMKNSESGFSSITTKSLLPGPKNGVEESS